MVGSIGSVHYAPNDGAAVRGALADPQTRMVSLTITDNGYFLNPVTDEFDADHPDVRADLVASGGYATAWGSWPRLLDRRRHAGVAPFTVLCSDNVAATPARRRSAVVWFGALKDPGLARWINTHVAFPRPWSTRSPPNHPIGAPFVDQTFGVADEMPW